VETGEFPETMSGCAAAAAREEKMNDRQDDAYRVAPGREVVVDRFRPEDAEGVVGCFRRVYGDGYPIKTFYDPELMIRENEAGRLISVVARTAGGRVVGHNGMFSSDPCNPNIYETGSGVVLPEYRNTAKLFSRMVAMGEEVGRDLGFEGIYGEPVCNHHYTQRMMKRLGYTTSALEVDLMPAEAYEREGSAPGRVSSFWSFKTLIPKPHTVYIPEPYGGFFHLAYQNLDDTRQVEIPDQPLPKSISTRIGLQVFDFALVARMAVHELGHDFRAVLPAKELEAEARGVICFQVWLNLGVPWIQAAVNILREKGYFLGGLLTRWFRTDGILMQKLKPRPCWEDIQVAFERDRYIVDAAFKDRKR
jgi:hypothetical protein